MQIEEGGTYQAADGRTYGPMRVTEPGSMFYPTWPFWCENSELGALYFKRNGKFFDDESSSSFDLVNKVVDLCPSADKDAYSQAVDDAKAELQRASGLFPAMSSAHEGYAVILEELDELKAHVWLNQKKRDLTAMRKEAIQVAAMALRFASEVCDEQRGRK